MIRSVAALAFVVGMMVSGTVAAQSVDSTNSLADTNAAQDNDNTVTDTNTTTSTSTMTDTNTDTATDTATAASDSAMSGTVTGNTFTSLTDVSSNVSVDGISDVSGISAINVNSGGASSLSANSSVAVGGVTITD